MDFTQSSLPTLTPPRAEVQDECLTHLGRERIDPFYYMRDKEDPRVLEYLRAENAYTAEVMASMVSIHAPWEGCDADDLPF